MAAMRDILIENPVIAAVRNDEELKKAERSSVGIAIVLYGNIMTLAGTCRRLREAGKTVFVHVEMIEGLKVTWPASILFVTPRASRDCFRRGRTSIKYAKQLISNDSASFLLDSLSLQTESKIFWRQPRRVEIMPGIACRLINEMEKKITVPVIAVGLIVSKEQVLDCLSNGAVAISTSKSGLWELKDSLHSGFLFSPKKESIIVAIWQCCVIINYNYLYSQAEN
jgi:glycerol uptake operon antiterminator